MEPQDNSTICASVNCGICKVIGSCGSLHSDMSRVSQITDTEMACVFCTDWILKRHDWDRDRQDIPQKRYNLVSHYWQTHFFVCFGNSYKICKRGLTCSAPMRVTLCISKHRFLNSLKRLVCSLEYSSRNTHITILLI